MRKYIFSVLIALLSLPVIAQQQQSQAKAVLEKVVWKDGRTVLSS